MLNRVLIISVFIVASCGLAYELIAGALSSYLLGDSVLQFSSIIGCYLFAMGVGSHISKYIKDEDALARFIDVELLVGLLGGISAMFLFVVFTWMSAPFRSVLYILVFMIGVLVGMEIPLVMRILHQRQTEFRDMVSKVLTFDYMGALVVSLLFPLLLAPKLGMSRSALLFGLLNASVALLTAQVFRTELKGYRWQNIQALVVLLILVIGFVLSNRVTNWVEKGVFGDQIVYSESTPYQRIVITRWKNDIRLFLNGNLQFSSRDEHRYHEALIHPGMQFLGSVQNVLLLGGGDGLAVRELLKYPQLKKITLVDLDPAMTRLFSTAPSLTALNKNALKDTRVRVVNDDAGRWIENDKQFYDFIVIDLPDPSNFALGKLYSVPMYKNVSRRLAENGYIVVQSTSPYMAPHAFWCVVKTLQEAGLNTWPYHVNVPSFGEWGFVLAGKRNDFIFPESYQVKTRFLKGSTTALMFDFPDDMQMQNVKPNYLNTQALVHYFEQDWSNAAR